MDLEKIIVICFKPKGYSNQTYKIIEKTRPHVSSGDCMILSASYSKCVNLAKDIRKSFNIPHIELIPIFDFDLNRTLNPKEFNSIISQKKYRSLIILVHTKKVQDIYKIFSNKFYNQNITITKPNVGDVFVFDTVNQIIQSFTS